MSQILGLSNGHPELSVIAPLFDEEDNVESLCREVAEALSGGPAYELILVDDGSRDRTWERLCAETRRRPEVRGLHLSANAGQTSALWTGISHARGRVIVTMDADGQHDPNDILKLVAGLNDGASIVCGVRARRRDGLLKRLSSRIANAVRRAVIGGVVHDAGCTFRAFAAETARRLPWFEGMHRFLPDILAAQGFRVAEIDIAHRPRLRGRSKYGIRNRIWLATKDLLAVRWMAGRHIKHLNVEEESWSSTLGSRLDSSDKRFSLGGSSFNGSLLNDEVKAPYRSASGT